jgi:hypothetical protein
MLSGMMVVLWWNWRGGLPAIGELVQALLLALVLALVAVYLLPALAFIGGGAVWAVVRGIVRR